MASVDTSYDDDFESASSSALPSPEAAAAIAAGVQQQSAPQPASASAAAARLALLRSTQLSKLPANAGSGGGSNASLSQVALNSSSPYSPSSPASNLPGSNSASLSWQRSSLKLERRGSELPEIPKIPEGPESDYEFDGEAGHEASAAELHSEDSSILLLDGPGKAGIYSTQQQMVERALTASTTPVTATVRTGARQPGGNGFAQDVSQASMTSLRTQPDCQAYKGVLDAVSEAVMEELLPPGSANGAFLGNSSISQAAASVSEEWPAAAVAGRTAVLRGGTSSAAGAALPCNTLPPRSASADQRAETTAAVTETVGIYTATALQAEARVASASASSYGSSNNSGTTGRPAEGVQPIAAESSPLSLESAMDDLLASSDLAVLTHIAAVPAAAAADASAAANAASQPEQQRIPRTVGECEPAACIDCKAQGTTASSAVAAAAQARRLSNYSDVSFLSDDEEGEATMAPAAAAVQQKQQPQRSTRRTDSGLSFVSSLDGSDVDIDYSAELSGPAAAASARPATRHGTAIQQQQQQLRPQVHDTHGVAAALHKGVQPETAGNSGVLRSAADVFYSHVSGTPGARTTSGRIW